MRFYCSVFDHKYKEKSLERLSTIINVTMLQSATVCYNVSLCHNISIGHNVSLCVTTS